ncbi:MAG: hypothetical protein GX625_10690 [Clostridiaceae bacterium]|nr:hypothetical protein [Clostridiaceae bacterium]
MVLRVDMDLGEDRNVYFIDIEIKLPKEVLSQLSRLGFRGIDSCMLDTETGILQIGASTVEYNADIRGVIISRTFI